ncbi:ABC transporter permease [Hyalangium rubrum]|uniref:ABC transporter permease n=1 Tax=Hyalangium rubrum TaxID=3103134 RepID=A0ABU5H0Y6_9BACT|nr:ABC transporter permease [Hyalangium sp. s54d21]MDY7227117.1 ABC transporter permease [Hyalangium sp. s54d21]
MSPAPRRRAAASPPLWGLRSNIPATTSRILGASSVALLLLVWCVLSYVRVDKGGTAGPEPLVSHFFLPPPGEVIRSLLYLFFEQDLLSAVWTSIKRILIAFGLSVAVALPLGILMGSFEAVNRFFDPIVAPLRYLPITAFIPLLILWFGIQESQKVAFLFLGTFVFLLPVVVDAIRVVPDELVQTAFTLGASRAQVIRTVLIPAAMPQIFDSFRVMNAIAWTYIILAEIVNPQNGIGYILRLAEQHFKPAWSFAGILVVGVIGILTDLGIRGINRLLFRWRDVDV